MRAVGAAATESAPLRRRSALQTRRASHAPALTLGTRASRRYRGAMDTPPSNPAPQSRGLRAWLSELTFRRVGVALGLATALSLALNPIFITSYPVVLARLLAIALVLLLAFTAARTWRVPGVPGWLAQVLAVALAAPLATLLAYLPSVGGDLAALFGHEGRVMGVVSITSTVLIIAPLLVLGSLYRERDAQARNQALAFELERSRLERQALDAQLKLLQAQIEPHFLFNTLANVQQLVESGSARAAPVLSSLVAYLRAATSRLHAEHPTLGNELAMVQAYLELMQMRMPDRLQFRVDATGVPAHLEFPALGLMTLVENAVRHGIDPSPIGGGIDVTARLDATRGDVSITVADSGVGMKETAPSGTGLNNLRSRLRAMYGSGARLELHDVQPNGLRAEIVFTPRAPTRG
jgi:signal transduction histidine kinase